MDDAAKTAAILQAVETYREMLATPPLTVRRIAAFFVGKHRQNMGAVIVDRDGSLRARKSFHAGAGWEVALARWMRGWQVQACVAPARASDGKRLTTLLRTVHPPPISVKAGGLTAGRALIRRGYPGLPREIGSAVVLALRAFSPLEQLCGIDPLDLGLTEHQQELDADRLRAALNEVRTSATENHGQLTDV